MRPPPVDSAPPVRTDPPRLFLLVFFFVFVVAPLASLLLMNRALPLARMRYFRPFFAV